MSNHKGTVKYKPLCAMLRHNRAPKMGAAFGRVLLVLKRRTRPPPLKPRATCQNPITWILMHFGGTPEKDVSTEVPTCSTEENELLAEQQRVHDEERLLNIVEVL